MKNIDISIIVPLYNSELYIEKCLQSIRNQTFKSYELIIVNDFSTDNSIEIVYNFIAQNPDINSIFVHNNENKGDNYSRNLGFRIATGEFVCFLDSDDILHPEFLSLLYSKLQSQNADLVFCGYNRCYGTKVIPYEKTWKYPQYNSIFKLKLDFMLGRTHICHCTIMYRRSFLYKTRLKYYPNCYTSGDTEFVTKILFNNPHFSCVPQSLYYYIIHKNSISTSNPSAKKFDGYYAYERARKYIKNPIWKFIFIITRETRKVTHIIEEFYENNVELPYFFCSKYKILFMLFINMLSKKTKHAYILLKYFWCTYIKKG